MLHMRAYAPGAWKWKGPYFFQSHGGVGNEQAARARAVLRLCCMRRSPTDADVRHATHAVARRRRAQARLRGEERRTVRARMSRLPARSLPHHSSAGSPASSYWPKAPPLPPLPPRPLRHRAALLFAGTRAGECKSLLPPKKTPLASTSQRCHISIWHPAPHPARAAGCSRVVR